jgi:hypothetical protein
MSSESTSQTATSTRRGGALRRLVALIGADNLSLMFALVVLILLITVVSGWFGLSGGNKFFSWQNLMNSLAQAIVIVGLLAIGETVVIVAGALDISVGSIASVGSVVAASVLVGVGVGVSVGASVDGSSVGVSGASTLGDRVIDGIDTEIDGTDSDPLGVGRVTPSPPHPLSRSASPAAGTSQARDRCWRVLLLSISGRPVLPGYGCP